MLECTVSIVSAHVCARVRVRVRVCVGACDRCLTH